MSGGPTLRPTGPYPLRRVTGCRSDSVPRPVAPDTMQPLRSGDRDPHTCSHLTPGVRAPRPGLEPGLTDPESAVLPITPTGIVSDGLSTGFFQAVPHSPWIFPEPTVCLRSGGSVRHFVVNRTRSPPISIYVWAARRCFPVSRYLATGQTTPHPYPPDLGAHLSSGGHVRPGGSTNPGVGLNL